MTTTNRNSPYLRDILSTLDIEADTPLEELEGDDLVNTFIALSEARKAADEQSNMLSRHTQMIEQRVVDCFAENGQQSVTRRGMTCYLSEEIWPKVECDDLLDGGDGSKAHIAAAKDMASRRLALALSSDPMTKHLVSKTYNYQQLRSFILNDCRDDEDFGEPVIPEHLAGALGFTKKHRAKVVKSRG